MKSLQKFSIMWTYSGRLLRPQGLLLSILTGRPLSAQPINCVQIQTLQIGPATAAGLETLQTWSTYTTAASTALSKDVALVDQNEASAAAPEDDLSLGLPITSSAGVMDEKTRVWSVGPRYDLPSYNLAPFANDSIILKKFVQLGVQVSKWEEMEGIPGFMLKLNFNRDVAPFIRFLVDKGVEANRLGFYFTKNPFIFKENIQNLEIRVKYLESKKFSVKDIQHIIYWNPYWLLFDTTRIDRRLGFFQSYFDLTGDQVRALVIRGPTLITNKIARVKDVTFTVKDEMGFEPEEVAQLLVRHPSIFRTEAKVLWRRFDYLHNELKFSHADLLRSPKLLLTRENKLKNRIGFLQSIARAQFNPEKPNYISSDNIVDGDDVEFAVGVAKSSVIQYNNYLKTL